MSTRFHGIEEYQPDARFPTQIPEGTYLVELQKAETFLGGPQKNKPTFVTEMKILQADDQSLVGKVFAKIASVNQFPSYYYGQIRGFVAAAMGLTVDDTTADVCENAVNERGSAPGTATGRVVAINVRINEKSEKHPHVDFYHVDQNAA